MVDYRILLNLISVSLNKYIAWHLLVLNANQHLHEDIDKIDICNIIGGNQYYLTKRYCENKVVKEVKKS